MAQQSPNKDIINEVVLRTQSQAVYSPDNIGHFGLNLARLLPLHLAHPPLRRRHHPPRAHPRAEARRRRRDRRRKKSATTKPPSTSAKRSASRWPPSATPPRATSPRSWPTASARTFEGRVTGVTRFGLFVRLDETQADGLAPISTLGNERWIHDETAHALVGEHSGERYPLGMRVEVRLEEATPISGGLVFSVLTDPLPPIPGWRKSRPSQQTRGGGGKHRDRDLKRGKRRR